MISDEKNDTTVRTFRLNTEWDTILKEEADKQSIIVSALLNQIIRRYAVAQRFFNDSRTVSVDYKIFSPILEMLTEEQITDFGNVIGTTSVREGITKRGLPIDFDSIEYLIKEVYDRYAGWFKCNTYKNSFDYVINLNHIFGRKWSLFVSSFMESMLKTLLDILISPEVYDNSVIIKIPKRQINRS